MTAIEMPDWLTERAVALARGESTWIPPVARPASTVILLRDSADGLETYLMRRARTMAFAPRMYVFPGGRVDAVDDHLGAQFDATAFDFVREGARASADEQQMRALVACAIREVREETSIDLPLSTSSFALLDHWVTPETESHRYDVRFFVASLPEGQRTRVVGTEADLVTWITPAAALDAYRADAMDMLPPTVAMLIFLAEHVDAASVLAASGRQSIAPQMPRALLNPDGSLRWVIVNERTGAVIQELPGPPEASEVLGAR